MYSKPTGGAQSIPFVHTNVRNTGRNPGKRAISRLRWHLSDVDSYLAAYSLKHPKHTDFKVRLVHPVGGFLSMAKLVTSVPGSLSSEMTSNPKRR